MPRRLPSDIPVLIVGGGPIGLIASLLLGRAGVQSLLVERRDGLHTSPQAHVISARSMEIFRSAGIDEAQIRKRATQPSDMGSILWVSTLTGRELGRLNIIESPEHLVRMLASSPTPIANLSQHHLEPILFAAADAQPASRLEFGLEWQEQAEDESGVEATLRDTATNELHRVRADRVLACDGAGSLVRAFIGIEMEGPDDIQSFANFHIEAGWRDRVGERPGMLYWCMDPETPGCFIAHDIDHTWVYMHQLDDESAKREDFEGAAGRSIVDRAIGRTDLPYEIKSVNLWSMTGQVAKTFGRGRTLLVGDAAHRFPPTGGIGMNTGIADAHNACWKIAAAHHGWAPQSLIDTYLIERPPIARANADQSLSNFQKMSEVATALEITEDAAETRARFETLDHDTAYRARIDAAIENQRDHFDMAGLDLGHCYEAGALLQDGSQRSAEGSRTRDYIPSTRPGCRLPHRGIVHAGKLASMIDLVDPQGFVLIVGAEADAWRAAVAEYSRRPAGAPIRLICVCEGGDAQDPSNEWRALSEVDDSGAILVRPDGHVAWRVSTAPPDAASALAKALRDILEPG